MSRWRQEPRGLSFLETSSCSGPCAGCPLTMVWSGRSPSRGTADESGFLFPCEGSPVWLLGPGPVKSQGQVHVAWSGTAGPADGLGSSLAGLPAHGAALLLPRPTLAQQLWGCRRLLSAKCNCWIAPFEIQTQVFLTTSASKWACARDLIGQHDSACVGAGLLATIPTRCPSPSPVYGNWARLAIQWESRTWPKRGVGLRINLPSQTGQSSFLECSLVQVVRGSWVLLGVLLRIMGLLTLLGFPPSGQALSPGGVGKPPNYLL